MTYQDAMMTTTRQYKTREELATWSGAELFAYALTHGFNNVATTDAKPGLSLGYSVCYGCGYSDTKFWTIAYTLDENGFPAFDPVATETLFMLLSGEHMHTWNALKGAEGAAQALAAARKAHDAFLAS